MNTVVLGLGSNNSFNGMSPVELLAHAVNELREVLEEISVSSIYESKAMYVTDQNNFFNMAVMGHVSDEITPYSLLNFIHKVEAKYGRDRSKEIRFGPRSLDIDIEEFGSVCLNEPDLILPHPRMAERQFVLLPVLEIFSKSADCLKKEQIKKQLDLHPDQGVVLCDEQVQKRFESVCHAKTF